MWPAPFAKNRQDPSVFEFSHHIHNHWATRQVRRSLHAGGLKNRLQKYRIEKRNCKLRAGQSNYFGLQMIVKTVDLARLQNIGLGLLDQPVQKELDPRIPCKSRAANRSKAGNVSFPLALQIFRQVENRPRKDFLFRSKRAESGFAQDGHCRQEKGARFRTEHELSRVEPGDLGNLCGKSFPSHIAPASTYPRGRVEQIQPVQ